MLQVNINKTLGDFRLSVSFETDKGVTGVLGASGCGKSLTLRCIAGIERPDEGRIVLDGQVLFDSEKHINVPPQKRRVGYLFQNYALFPNMTVKKNILCGLCRERDTAKRREELKRAIGLLQLEGLENHRPIQLSGGQAQRVALARILVSRPRLLMLDEPFSAIDSHLREHLQIEMKRLLEQYGGMVLFVTHDRNEAYYLCDRIATMDSGMILTLKPAKTGEQEAEVPGGGKQVKELMACISQWLNQGEDVALATIVAGSGSTPRGAGARLAMTANGSFTGTIGGGALEYRVQQMALDALENKKSASKAFTLRPGDRDALGMICGGDVTVYIQYISALDEQAREVFAYGEKQFSQNSDTWLVTDITSETGWHMGICTGNACVGNIEPSAIQEKSLFTNKGVLVEISGRRYFSGPLTRAGKVFVFGGGHISQELIPLLSHLGFSCVLFDDLPKFANKELFPQADSVILGDFNDICAYVNITEKDYVVVMTRGHSSDFAVQSQALALKPLYIGAIGSRKKIEGVSKRLLEQGYSQEEIDRVHSPIGIAIKADTPAEIAVSIAAELVMVRAGGNS